MKRHLLRLGIDVFFGAYIATIIDRILIPRVILDNVTTPFDGMHQAFVIGLALVFAVLGSVTSASVGRLILDGSVSGSWQRSVAMNIAWIGFTLTVLAGWVVTGISPSALFNGQGLEGAGRIFKALFTPNTDIIGAALLAMVETIYLAFMATAIAVPFSFALSFFAARNLMDHGAIPRTIYVAIRFVTNFTRSIEPLIWAIIFSVWVGIGPFAGMLALVVHTISSLTKQYSEQIEDVDTGPMEAISATGASRTQVVWFSVVPQCVIPFLSFTIYRWDINVRMATVIGLVGGGGIGTMLIQYQGLAQWREVGTIVILIALVVWIMDVISARIREALK